MVHAIFDTGSANPWILGKQGTLKMDGLKSHSFDPALSPDTFKEPAEADK